MSLRLLWQIFNLELRKVLSYRVDFWASFLGVVIVEFCIAYFLWGAIYRYKGVEVLNGFSFPAMMLYYLLIPILGNITYAQAMHFISRDIYEGSLNRYLVYPLNFFGYKFMAHLAFSLIGILQLLAALALYVYFFDVPESLQITPASIAGCIIASLFSAALYFLIASCLEMVAFWADNVWSLLAMLRMTTRLLGGGLIPLAFFPEWSIELLRVLPFYCFTALPVEIAMGYLTPAEFFIKLAIASFWILVAAGLVYTIWSRGKYRYSGVGI